MKHLFIINPAAGGKKADSEGVRTHIAEMMARRGCEYEIYITRGPMDACDKVRSEAERGEELRVYACGGDGTLNECVNGVVSRANAAVTHYPCGTGNDFIKTFGEDAKLFFDLERLIDGKVRPIDAIDVNGRCGVSICSVGIDARVGADVHKYSKLPVIGGATGYVVSMLVNIFKGINMPMAIRTNGESIDGEFALMCACNGRYYGGGFQPVPDAMPDDGIMNVLLVKKLNLLGLLPCIGKYAAGQYKKLGDKVIKIDTDELELVSDKQFVINVDGEVFYDSKAVFRVICGGVNIIFPQGTRFFEARDAKQTAI